MGSPRTALQRFSAEYDNYYNAELEELAQNYGDLVEFWLDGAGSAGHVYDFKKIIETLRTHRAFNAVSICRRAWACLSMATRRWVGNEALQALSITRNWKSVIDRHGYRRWRPVEADTPLRDLHWFWHPRMTKLR